MYIMFIQLSESIAICCSELEEKPITSQIIPSVVFIKTGKAYKYLGKAQFWINCSNIRAKSLQPRRFLCMWSLKFQTLGTEAQGIIQVYATQELFTKHQARRI